MKQHIEDHPSLILGAVALYIISLIGIAAWRKPGAVERTIWAFNDLQASRDEPPASGYNVLFQVRQHSASKALSRLSPEQTMEFFEEFDYKKAGRLLNCDRQIAGMTEANPAYRPTELEIEACLKLLEEQAIKSEYDVYHVRAVVENMKAQHERIEAQREVERQLAAMRDWIRQMETR